MPKLGIVQDPTPNAFVFGLTQEGSTLSVHRGLLEQLNDREIEAVLAHEIGHIKNRDCMYMTILSTIPLLAYFGMNMLLYMRFGGGGKDAGKLIAIMILIGIVSAVVYFITSLLIKRISRIREFYADAYSAYIMKDPQSLASALTKITYGLSLSPPEEKSKSAARSFYIGDVQNAHKEMDNIVKNKSKYDLDGDGVIDEHELELAMQDEAGRGAWDSFGGLFATHPPTYKRILALKDMQKDFDTGQINEANVYEKVEF
jgi:Zn-dependent protease with chaperone function